MLGTKLYKNKAGDMDIYSQCAEWCNETQQGRIVDKGEYYEVIEYIPISIPIDDTPTIADLVEALDILSNIVLGGE